MRNIVTETIRVYAFSTYKKLVAYITLVRESSKKTLQYLALYKSWGRKLDCSKNIFIVVICRNRSASFYLCARGENKRPVFVDRLAGLPRQGKKLPNVELNWVLLIRFFIANESVRIRLTWEEGIHWGRNSSLNFSWKFFLEVGIWWKIRLVEGYC
jgi:hypothetical protein